MYYAGSFKSALCTADITANTLLSPEAGCHKNSVWSWSKIHKCISLRVYFWLWTRFYCGAKMTYIFTKYGFIRCYWVFCANWKVRSLDSLIYLRNLDAKFCIFITTKVLMQQNPDCIGTELYSTNPKQSWAAELFIIRNADVYIFFQFT